MAEVPLAVKQPEDATAEHLAGVSRLDLRSIVIQYHHAVYSYAFRLTGNQADAEDLAQQTFLVAQQRLYQVREPEKILSWLFAVVRSSYGKGCRKWRPALAGNLELDLDHVPDPVTSEQIDRQGLQLALDDLPEEFRIVVTMFYFEDCSYKEIACQLEIPIGTVMSRLARAKAQLRRRLSPAPDRPDGETRSSGSLGPSAESVDRLAHKPNGQ